MCLTFVIAFCTFDCQMIPLSNIVDAMVSRSKVGEGTKFDYPNRNHVLKTWFLDIDEKEVDNVNKGGTRKLANMPNYGRKMHLMSGKSSACLMQQD
jgi:hypothetical protein